MSRIVLVCTGHRTHEQVRLGTVVTPDETAPFLVELLHVPRRGAWQTDSRGRRVLRLPCPFGECHVRFERREAKLRAMLDAVDAAGRNRIEIDVSRHAGNL